MFNLKLMLFWLLAFAAVPLAAQDEELDAASASSAPPPIGDDETAATNGELADTVGEPEAAAEAEGGPDASATEMVSGEGEAATVDGAQASTPVPLPSPSKGSTTGKPDLIADGGRVSVREGDFSIKPPLGWEVFTTLDSLTLLMQVPHETGMRYQRTIQVASFSEPRFIDDMTAKEYETVIVKKFSSISSAIEDYRIRNHMTVELADGRQGILFYTEFKFEGVSLMQAHILVSSASRHYLMTFTDVAEHFESDSASQYLTEAWDSMISVELATRTPKRFETFAAIGVSVVVLMLAGFGFFVFRAWRSGRKYQDYANGKDGDLDDDPMTMDPQTLASGAPISNVRSINGSSKKDKYAVTGAEAELGDDLDNPSTKDDIAI